MTAGRMEFASFVAGNYLYALGGEVRQNGTWISSATIERASINPNGSINPWQIISSMPTGRHAFAAVYVDGDLYVLGGVSIGNPNVFLNTVDAAPVNPDGSIGPWQSMPAMLTGRYLYGAIATNSYLYAIGGSSGTIFVMKSVERATIIVDSTPPVMGSFAINGGALASTSRNVTLNVSASDSQSGVAWMSFSDDGDTWSDWLSYSPSSSWLLTDGDGIKTISVRVKDMAGNVSLVSQGSIQLDTSVGTENGFTINNGALFTNNTAVTLTISSQPGTALMKICNDGGFFGAAWDPYAAHRPWTITQFGNSVIPRVVYLRYKDMNGNVSPTFQDDIILDVTPPVGSVRILPISAGLQLNEHQSGLLPTSSGIAAAYTYTLYLPMVTKGYCAIPTGTANVTLRLQATDDVSGVGQMLVSNYPDFPCAEWTSFVANQAWYMPSGDDTVYVRFRDIAGNTSDTVIDTLAP